MTIHYHDGTTAEYKSVGLAATALQCSEQSIQRMANGLATTLLRAHGISSVSIAENKGRMKGLRRHGGKPSRILCTNEATGDTIIADCIADAKQRTKFQHYILPCVDSGEYHWGWRFDTIPDQDRQGLDFPTVVPAEIAEQAVRMAYGYASRHLDVLDRDDMAQYTACHTVSDYSKGLYDRDSARYALTAWLWCRTRTWANRWLKRTRKWREGMYDADYTDITKDNWLASLAPETDEESPLLRDIPEDLRPLAECLMHGMDRYETEAALQITTAERIQQTGRLREWLTDNGYGDGYGRNQ